MRNTIETHRLCRTRQPRLSSLVEHPVGESPDKRNPSSKWRECATIFEPKCGNAARMVGIVLRLSEKAAPEAAYFAPFVYIHGRMIGTFPPPVHPQGISYCQRSSAAIWIRLPQVSFTMAMVEPVTLVGGMLNSAPAAFMRSYSRWTSST
jgi:hypothetical protein